MSEENTTEQEAEAVDTEAEVNPDGVAVADDTAVSEEGPAEEDSEEDEEAV